MKQDSWISAETAALRLEQAGYDVDRRLGHIAYRKTGVFGKITIHSWGVDEWAVFRLLDRGS